MRYVIAFLIMLMPLSELRAQTTNRLLEGAKTYYLGIDALSGDCLITKEFVRKSVMFPLSYSDLRGIESSGEEDIWINIDLNVDPHDSKNNKCFGRVSINVMEVKYGTLIKFNQKIRWSETPLWGGGVSFIFAQKSTIGTILEDLMKSFITDYNMDNK